MAPAPDDACRDAQPGRSLLLTSSDGLVNDHVQLRLFCRRQMLGLDHLFGFTLPLRVGFALLDDELDLLLTIRYSGLSRMYLLSVAWELSAFA